MAKIERIEVGRMFHYSPLHHCQICGNNGVAAVIVTDGNGHDLLNICRECLKAISMIFEAHEDWD